MDSSFDIEKHIANKIEEINVSRREIRESLDGLQVKLESAYGRIGSKPRETDEDIVRQSKELEFWHSTTSQNNASERKFMLDMEKFKKRRLTLVEHTKLQEGIDSLKGQKKDLQQSLRDKEKHLDELHQAVRKLKTASKVGCNPAEVVERVVSASETQIPVSMFRQLAEQYSVDVSSTKVGGSRSVRVQGVEDAVTAVFVRIDELLKNISQEVSVSNSTIYCLLMMNAAMLNRIEKDYTVRIDLSRAALTCKVAGLPENVATSISEIESIQSASVDVKYENSALPFIIGKGGSGLRAIEQENCVHLDIDREKGVIIVTGFVDDVAAAAELIKDAADGNRQVEEILKIPRHIFLGCLQRDGGAVLKTVRADYPAVVIQTLKALERQKQNASPTGATTSTTGGRPSANPPTQAALDKAVAVDKSSADSTAECEYLLFKGPAMRAIPARNAIQSAVDEHIANTVCVAATSDSIGFVVGKRGVRVDALRKTYPTASVDVSKDTVYVYSACAEERAAVQKEVQDIIDENKFEFMSVSEETARSLVGVKGVDARAELDALGLNAHIDIEGKSVKIRGRNSCIEQGIELIRQFELDHSYLEVPVSEEDCSALASGGVDAAYKEFETLYNVEIYVGRKNQIIKIRGHRDSITAAADAISRLLAGEAGSDSQLMPYDKSDLRFLIGKGGETIAKFETDHDVRIDILKSSEFLRVRGKTADGVSGAVAAIHAFLCDVMDVIRIPAVITDTASADALSNHMAAVKELFPVKVLSLPASYLAKTSSGGNRGNRGGKGNRKQASRGGRKPAGGGRSGDAAAEVDVVEVPAEEAVEPTSGDPTTDVTTTDVTTTDAPADDAPAATGSKDAKAERSGRGGGNGGTADGRRPPDDMIVFQGKRRVLKAVAGYMHSLLSGSESYSYQLSAQQFHTVHPLLDSPSRKAGVEKFGSTLSFDIGKKLLLLSSAPPSAMIKSKAMLFRFLDEFMPGQFASVALPPACLSHFSSSGIDTAVAGMCGVDIQYDYHFSCLRISADSDSTGGDAVANALALIDTHRSEWSERCIIIDLDDASVIPYLVGKGGVHISEIEKSAGVSVQIDAKRGQVKLQGQSKEACQAGAEKVHSRIAQYAKEHWSNIVSDIDALASLIGKGGAKINQLRADTGANIDINLDTGSIRVTGSEEVVLKAKDAIETAMGAHADNATVVKVRVPGAAFALIVGKKGATIQDLQTSSEVRRIDLDRDAEMVIIRGSAASCAIAESKITALLEQAGFNNEPVVVAVAAPVAVSVAEVAVEEKAAPVFGGGYVKSNGNHVVLSKSHLKRMRRREPQATPQEEESDSECGDDVSAPVASAGIGSSVSVPSTTSVPASAPAVTAPAVTAAVTTTAPVTIAPTNASANSAALDALLADLGVTSLSVDTATASAAFTPFSGPSVVPSPVYASLSPDASTQKPFVHHSSNTDTGTVAGQESGPPGLAQAPVRSMRSARVGIIGSSSGSAKALMATSATTAGTPAATPTYQPAVNGTSHGIAIDNVSSPNYVTAMPPGSSDSMGLLSLLLDDSTPAAGPMDTWNTASSSGGKASGASAALNGHGTQNLPPPAPSSSASSNGYYKSKGGFSVRLN